jgi:hypothetical protein
VTSPAPHGIAARQISYLAAQNSSDLGSKASFAGASAHTPLMHSYSEVNIQLFQSNLSTYLQLRLHQQNRRPPTPAAAELCALAEVGVEPVSYATLKRRLPVYAKRSSRQSLAAASARHAGLRDRRTAPTSPPSARSFAVRDGLLEVRRPVGLSAGSKWALKATLAPAGTARRVRVSSLRVSKSGGNRKKLEPCAPVK